VGAIVKFQPFDITEPDEVYHRCRAAIQQLLALVATSKFVPTANGKCVPTSALHHD